MQQYHGSIIFSLYCKGLTQISYEQQSLTFVVYKLLMKKFAVNYSRPFPDHRIPFDYKFDK